MCRHLYGFIAFVIAIWCAPAFGATYTASSCSSTDVQSAMNSATASGDIVAIPACTGGQSWTSGVSWNAPDNAVLKGAGSESILGGNDQTVIIDNLSGSGPVVEINISAGDFVRIWGITFRSGSGGVKDSGGILRINGDTGTVGVNPAEFRIDHCNFDSLTNSRGQDHMIELTGNLIGVIDNNELGFYSVSGIYPYNGGSSLGDNSWAVESLFGTKYFIYIEDNVVTGDSTACGTRVYDGYSGSRVVVRFNDLAYSSIQELHTTGHSGDDRGARAYEVYNNENTQVCLNVSTGPGLTFVDGSSGTGRIWGNDSNNGFRSYLYADIDRAHADTYSQQATPTGWGYCGTEYNGTGSNWDGGTWNSTDTTYGYPCLDQPGRGAGDLITGLHPNRLNDTSSQIEWPDQALDPIYFFYNAGTHYQGWSGSDDYTNIITSRVVEDRDYYIQDEGQTAQTTSSSPFNGTTGTGWGELTNRPTTCTTGVAYWATDQGSWNTSSSNTYGVQRNGEDGVLYKCTATDTWTASYTPYTYPHPLRSGESGESVTTTLKGISGNFSTPQ